MTDSRLALELREVWAEAMRGVSLGPVLRERVEVVDVVLRVGDARVALAGFRRVVVAALGKAAVAMAEYVDGVLREGFRGEVQGVVAGPKGLVRAVRLGVGWQLFGGGHPVPDKESFVAGRAMLEMMRGADAETLAVFLVSGGGSAMAEWPREGVSEAEVTKTYGRLVVDGETIAEVNARRRGMSALKGGGLARAAGAATKVTVIVSDVPAGRPELVASGPSLAWVGDEVVPAGVLPSVCMEVLSSEDLERAALRAVQTRGWRVVVENGCDDWEYRAAAGFLLARIEREVARGGGPVCVVSVGEVTVRVEGAGGCGGRNQQWAMEMARLLRGRGTGWAALSVGSDGVDGSSTAAGAVVDGTTWERMEDEGLEPAEAMRRFDVWPVLKRIGALLEMGPTGTNVRDLRVLVVE